MFSKIVAVAAVFAAQAVAQEDQANYSEFAEYLTWASLDHLTWEPYDVTTTDGWVETVFRLYDADSRDDTKNPVYLMHGAGGAAQDWLFSWAPELIDYGFELWLGTSRGTVYGNTNINDGSWTNPEDRWDWSFAEQGTLDIPAQLDKLLEVTGKEKAIVGGYSQGTSALYYGLATQQDYYATRVERAIMFASCFVMPGMDYTEQVARFQTYQDLNYLNFGGEDEYDFDLTTFCANIPTEYDGEKEGCGGDTSEKLVVKAGSDSIRAASVKTTMYYAQLSVEGPQEFIPFADWAAGTRSSTAVDFSLIDRTPIAILHPEDDQSCPLEQAQLYYDTVTVADKLIHIDDGGHGIYAESLSQREFMSLLELFEYGTMNEARGLAATVGSILVGAVATALI